MRRAGYALIILGLALLVFAVVLHMWLSVVSAACIIGTGVVGTRAQAQRPQR